MSVKHIVHYQNESLIRKNLHQSGISAHTVQCTLYTLSRRKTTDVLVNVLHFIRQDPIDWVRACQF
jgi:hypothetical protein